MGWLMAEHLGHQLALAALAIARQWPAPSLVHYADRSSAPLSRPSAALST